MGHEVEADSETPGSAGPFLPDDPGAWDRLIAAVNPASMLVVIHELMGPGLRAHLSPDDVWQETLLHAWRDRARFQGSGTVAFRHWLIGIARHRVHDQLDRETAGKRGQGKSDVPLSRVECLEPADGRPGCYAGPVATTTPGRAAMDRERAEAMIEGLQGLDDDVRDVVRLRLFEDLTTEEVAARLGLGVSAVQHRFRRGIESYYRRILPALSTAIREKVRAHRPRNPHP